MVGARVRRQQVAYAERRGLSRRRACAVLSVARSTLGYTSRLETRDAPVVAVMREVAGQYPRYGYRKIRIFLGRRGYPMSADRAYRLWRQAGLQVPRRRPRRRVATSRPLPLPDAPTRRRLQALRPAARWSSVPPPPWSNFAPPLTRGGSAGEDGERVRTRSKVRRAGRNHHQSEDSGSSELEKGLRVPPTGSRREHVLPIQLDRRGSASGVQSRWASRRGRDRVQRPQPDDWAGPSESHAIVIWEIPLVQGTLRIWIISDMVAACSHVCSMSTRRR